MTENEAKKYKIYTWYVTRINAEKLDGKYGGQEANARGENNIEHYNVVSLCRGFVTRACISLGRVGMDTGCAASRRVERTVMWRNTHISYDS